MSSIRDSTGMETGKVTHHGDGSHPITLLKGADFSTMVSAMAIVFSDHLSEPEKEAMADWMGLPASPWTPKHREMFSRAFLHYLYDLKQSGQTIPKSARGMVAHLSASAAIELHMPLSAAARRVLEDLFRSMDSA